MSGGFVRRLRLRLVWGLRPGLSALLVLGFIGGALLGSVSGDLSVFIAEPEAEPKPEPVPDPGPESGWEFGAGAGERYDPKSVAREAEAACLEMLNERMEALVTGDTRGLKDNYKLSSDSGYWAWEREVLRNQYFRKWAEERGVTITAAEATFEIDSTIVDDATTVWIELTELARYEYTYDGEDKSHRFGSRSLHVVQMVKENGQWLMRLHWYVDPLGQGSYSPAEGIAGPLNITPAEGRIPAEGESSGGHAEGGSPAEGRTPAEFDRDAALKYAIKYSGVRVFPGVERYNRAYRVYSFAGGDCANFVSQVLNAGGLEQGYGWHYTSEGSTAWVRSESLMWFLLSSGAGKLLYKGKFAGAVTPTEEFPLGPVAALEPGDIIGYEDGGELHHVAVVVGKDPKGYVTIGSHTSDRLFFPWDLGWDKDTVFWLVKITY